MAKQRVDRLNSLLKEVISEVIRRDVHNPHVAELMTVTGVDITKDLHYAKVYVSVIGTQQQKTETLKALNSAAGFIAVNSSKKVVMRYFPALTFKLDESVDKHMRIEQLLTDIGEERKHRSTDISDESVVDEDSDENTSEEADDIDDDFDDDFDDEESDLDEDSSIEEESDISSDEEDSEDSK